MTDAVKAAPQPRGHYPKRIKKGDTLGLGRKITHWLIDHGGIEEPIPVSHVYIALTLKRYKYSWRNAISEMVKRGIVGSVKGGIIVKHPERLFELEQIEMRKEQRRASRKKRHRPKSQWYLDNIESKRRHDEDEDEDMREDVKASFDQHAENEWD